MANLTDADKVLRNDVGKSIVSKLDDIADAIVQHGGGAESLGQLSDVDIDTTTLAAGQSIVYNPTTQKFENGEVSTVAALDDLTDVSITSAQKGDSLRNDGNGNWVNEPTKIVMTQAEWDAIVDKQAWRNAHKNTDLVLSDAPNLNATAEDISYDGSAVTVKDTIDLQALTFSENQGYTVARYSGGRMNKLVAFSALIQGAMTANTWNEIGTIDAIPTATVMTPFISNQDGSFCGMLSISDAGAVRTYPIKATSYCAFSIAYATT